jgi:hypothetical protein
MAEQELPKDDIDADVKAAWAEHSGDKPAEAATEAPAVETAVETPATETAQDDKPAVGRERNPDGTFKAKEADKDPDKSAPAEGEKPAA